MSGCGFVPMSISKYFWKPQRRPILNSKKLHKRPTVFEKKTFNKKKFRQIVNAALGEKTFHTLQNTISTYKLYEYQKLIPEYM